MIGIYKITSSSGKIYIGQSWAVNQRFKNYFKIYNVKGQTKLYNSFIKYGVENHKFEIVIELPCDISQEILDNYEIFVWKQFKEAGYEMLNIREPGKGGKLSEETKKKMSKSGKMKVFSEEHKRNISKAVKGRKCSEETKRKMSLLTLNNKRRVGKKHSEETKLKIREKNLKYFDYRIMGNAI